MTTARTSVSPPAPRHEGIDRAAARLAAGERTATAIIGPAGAGPQPALATLVRAAEARGLGIVHAVGHVAVRDSPLGAFAAALATIGSRTDPSSAVTELRAATTDAGLLVAIVDAHLLDPLSQALVVQLRSATALVVTGPALAPLLDLLPVDYEVVDLGPVDPHTFARLMTSALGSPVNARLVDAVHQMCDGLPGLLPSVLDAATVDEAMRLQAGSWALAGPLRQPPEVAAYADHRLDGAAAVRNAAELLAVCEPLPLRILEALIERDVLDELDSLGLLGVSDEAESDVCLASVPLRERLQSTCPPLRTIRHQRTVLSAVVDDRSVLRPSDEVHHAVLSLRLGEPVARDEALALARRAISLGGPGAARALARHAATDPALHDSATIVLAEALMATGREHEADLVLMSLGPPADRDLLAIWTMARIVNLFYNLGRADDALEVLTEAAALLPEWAGELIGLHGTLLTFLGRPTEALAMVDQQLAATDGRAAAQARLAAAPALWQRGRFEDAADMAASGAAIRRGLGDAPLLADEGTHLLVRAMALTLAGHLDEADALSRVVFDRVAASEDTDAQLWAGVTRGRVLLDRGRLRDAVHVFRDTAALAEAQASRPHLMWSHAGLVRGLALLRAPGLDDAEADLRLVASEPFRMMETERHRAHGWAAAARGDLEAARGWMRDAADGADEEIGWEMIALHDLVRMGDLSGLDRIQELADVVQGPMAQAWRTHASALASGDARSLDQVACAFSDMGALLLAAEVSAQAAAVWRSQGDLRAGRASADASMAAARHCQGAQSPALVLHPSVSKLSEREHQVALLAANGLADKQIAVQLAISHRTVGNLLARAYNKLGVDGRGALGDIFGARR